MEHRFVIEYAAGKDSMSTVAGFVHVAVDASTNLDARLVAEQMVAAVGCEPVQVHEMT